MAWGLGRYVGSQLYGVTGSDPLTVAGACLLLAFVALLAGYIPARRATCVNPVLPWARVDEPPWNPPSQIRVSPSGP